MTEVIDRALSVLPGSKTYLTGIVMAMIAIVQAAGLSTVEIDAIFDPANAGNLLLEGLGLIFIRRGIKDNPPADTNRGARLDRPGLGLRSLGDKQ